MAKKVETKNELVENQVVETTVAPNQSPTQKVEVEEVDQLSSPGHSSRGFRG
jgi:hypothetical protein